MKQVLLFLTLNLMGIVISKAQVTIEDPTANKGKVEWQWRVEVGKTSFGVPVSGIFKIKNVSDSTLSLLHVESGCKCTITDYTKEAIAPGGEGFIKEIGRAHV